MKESRLKGHKKYSNLPYHKIRNYIEDEETNKVYLLPQEHIQLMTSISPDSYNILDSSFVSFRDKNTLDMFLSLRRTNKYPLYFVLKELMKVALQGDKYIKKITILSSTFRYVFRHETTEKYDLFSKMVTAFKTLSTYKLHCLCTFTVIKNGITIWVYHSPYQERNRKGDTKNEESV